MLIFPFPHLYKLEAVKKIYKFGTYTIYQFNLTLLHHTRQKRPEILQDVPERLHVDRLKKKRLETERQLE